MIKEKNGIWYVFGEKQRLEFNTKEEAEKAAGISHEVKEVIEAPYGSEEEEEDYEEGL